jgi:hypothetical protein
MFVLFWGSERWNGTAQRVSMRVDRGRYNFQLP